MRRILQLTLMASLCFSFSIALAQERIISGKVTSAEDGSPITGVNVILMGTSSGTITDIDGNYSLTVPGSDAVITFSFIGLKSEDVLVGSRSVIDVQMETDAQQLSEVVIVAYGEESRRTLTGSVSKIDEDLIKKQQITSVGQALQGTVAGVNVIASSGQPGTSPTITIRGVSSINSATDPLIVVDGAVYSQNLNTIDPNSIESMSILKDASASALYGARAANGVVLITTKSGQPGKPQINFNYSKGISSRARDDYEFLSTEQQMKLEWETLYNDALDVEDPNPGQYASNNLIARVGYNPYGVANPINENGELIPGAELLWSTDWNEELTRTAKRTDAGMGISGGTEAFRYFVGASLLDQEGIVINSDFKRYSGNLNLDAELTDWLSIGSRQSLSYSESNFPSQSGSSFSNTIQYIRNMSSIYPVYKRDASGQLALDANGNPIYDDGNNNDQAVNGTRPLLSPGNAVAETVLDEALQTRFFGKTNFFAQIDFLKNFNIRSSYSYNYYSFDNFSSTNQTIGSAKTVGGRLSRQRDITNEWTWTNSINFNKSFNGGHNLDVLALQELYNYTIQAMTAQATGLPFDGLKEFNSAATNELISGSTNQERISSLMGRLKYNFDQRYFAEFSYRRDGSTRFAPDSRIGNFFAVAGSWLLSDESFMANVGFIDFLKLRASWGEIGNNRVVDPTSATFAQWYFPYLNVFNTGYDQLSAPGVYIGPLANPDITWEKVQTTNIGLDFGILNNRIQGSIDAYKKATVDLVLSRPLANSLGVVSNSITENTGEVVNRGIEVALNGAVIQKDGFTLNVFGNVAFQENEITDFPQDELINGSKKLQVGKSIFDFYIEEWAGVDEETGKPLWYIDVEDPGTGEITKETTDDYNEASRYYAGTSLPWMIGGFGVNSSIKGFDFSLLFNYAVGNKILDSDYQGLSHNGRRAGQQSSIDVLGRWQQPGDVTDIPRFSTADQGNSRSTRFLYDGDYLRLRNVTLGYTLDNDVFNTDFFTSFRVFVQGDNLLTFTEREGLDPEQSLNGLTNNTSAVFKTFSAGVELRF